MLEYIEQYIRNCRTYHQTKRVRDCPFGRQKSLPVPQQPWQEVSMDFVMGLPNSEGFDATLVVVDRLTKTCGLILFNETTGPSEVARLYLDHVWKLHGITRAIVSNCFPQVTASLWWTNCHLLRITPRLSRT